MPTKEKYCKPINQIQITMTEKTYSFKEMADMCGMEPEPFKDLILELGLIDKNGRPTPLALENGLLVERIVPRHVE